MAIDGLLLSSTTHVDAQVTTPDNCFDLFLTGEYINIIVIRTNQKIDAVAKNYTKQTATVKRTSVTEIHALLDVLVFSGIGMTIAFGGSILSLVTCLRFDDFTTRVHRQIRPHQECAGQVQQLLFATLHSI